MMIYNICLFLIILLFTTSNGDIVSELKNRFNDLSTHCIGSNNKPTPAYECSGLLIRGFDNRILEYPWSLKPRNHVRNSVSFSFLRRDALFNKFAMGYESGFIMYPHLRTPRTKKTCNVWCAFPLDAYSNYRRGEHGCGQSDSDLEGTSRQCDEQGITSFEKWLSHYKEITSSPENEYSNFLFIKKQCGFDMSKSTAARDFTVTLNATSYLKNTQFSFNYNEVLVKIWNVSQVRTIPIQAFFFLLNNDKSYEDELRKRAFKYQSIYSSMSGGEIVPVIGIRLPTPQKPDLYIEYKSK